MAYLSSDINLISTGILYESRAVIVEEQASGDNAHDGASFTSGDWRDRILNTELSDPDGIASLSSNAITLVNGTYDIEFRAPAMRCGRHVARLQETTGDNTVGIGQSFMVNTGDSHSSSPSIGFAMNVACTGSNNVFKVQHQCSDTRGTYGFGHYNGFATSYYTTVIIYKHTAKH